jgi:hypothetical protein
MSVYIRVLSLLFLTSIVTACDGGKTPSLSLLAGPLGGAGYADR